MDNPNERIRDCATIGDIVPKMGLSADEHYDKASNPAVSESPNSHTSGNQSSALVVPDPATAALQQQYIAAILKNKPGMTGEKTEAVARDLINSGLQPSEALMMINLVYGGPNNYESGQGQATRTRYFVEAVKEVWGDRLENASKNPALFRGLLAKLNEATQLHDDIAEANNPENMFRYGLSFKESLLLQEVGVDTDYFLALMEDLVSEYDITRRIAKARIVEAAGRIKTHQGGSLEGLLFPPKPSERDSEYYEQ